VLLEFVLELRFGLHGNLLFCALARGGKGGQEDGPWQKIPEGKMGGAKVPGADFSEGIF
jgi:hypothetical protein